MKIRNKRLLYTLLSITTFILLFILTYAYVGQVKEVNGRIPPPRIVTFQQGELASYEGTYSPSEVVSYGDITVKVESCSFLSFDELLKIVPGYKDVYLENGTASDVKAMLVSAVFSNNTNESIAIPLTGISAESRSWSAIPNLDLSSIFNDGTTSKDGLAAGESVVCNLVYLLYDIQFLEHNEWNETDTRAFNLVLSVYPTKYQILLDDGKKDYDKYNTI